MSTSSASPPTDAATSQEASASTTEPSEPSAPSSESSSPSTTEEISPGPSEIARALSEAGEGYVPELTRRTALRFLGDEYYLVHLKERGYEQAGQEACERFGHAGVTKGMCERCGAGAASVRDAWLQTRYAD